MILQALFRLKNEQKHERKTTVWNMVNNNNTKEDVTAYLETALEENDTEFLFKVIGIY